LQFTQISLKKKIPPNFVLDASKFIAERLGKPESVSVVNHWEQKKEYIKFAGKREII
jgi:hypothetical protein